MKFSYALGIFASAAVFVSAVSPALALTVGLGTSVGVESSVGGSLGASTSAAVSVSETVIPSMQVRTGDDLEVYADSVEQTNESITSVSSSDDSVSVGHTISAKLFGFIPVSMTETISVTVDGGDDASVTVKRPWWSFLATAPDERAMLASRVRAYLPESISVDGELDANIKAQFISAIEAATIKD